MIFVARFFLLVLVLTSAELYLLVYVASQISFGLTLLLCVFTGVLGGSMVRKQGLATLAQIQGKLGQSNLPGEQIISGLILLCIGVLLITPGFITDSVGFVFLIPPFRRFASRRLSKYFQARAIAGGMAFAQGKTPPSGSARTYEPKHQQTGHGPGRPRNEDIVIEVEAED